jgi:hypothetical protein
MNRKRKRRYVATPIRFLLVMQCKGLEYYLVEEELKRIICIEKEIDFLTRVFLEIVRIFA